MNPEVPHAAPGEASAWVRRFAPLIRAGGTALDYACGSGRHARLIAALGVKVDAVDRDASALESLSDVDGVRTILADLESDEWIFDGERYDAIVVTNYLFRPRVDDLLGCLDPGGMLIYETFMLGNERFGRPSNPEFLLAPGELLERVRSDFSVVAFEQGEVSVPKPAMVQRICAIKGQGRTIRLPNAR
ncbi:MAG TPA: methyltransferase domain-containing protein [Rhodocyclaceae bacterium]|nr:methyltransferase domain-containing protein [Rhodocyclaceae bacterium]HRQ46785.1 methyltransferase domain-containing protein [Rhodocyclaceae bacterium]